ncbi:MAG: NUDIX domain-containing protein [Haloferacaceae archaeon]
MADADTDTESTHVVTVFLRNDGEVLLLRRSGAVGTYSGRWGAVSGYAEGDPDAAARWEINEETGLREAVTLVRAGDPFTFADDDVGTRWTVHPYLFDCDSREVRTNRESTETAWVAATEILRRETVPRLWTSYDRVRPTVESATGDREHGSAYVSVRALEVLRDEAGVLAARAHEAGSGGERGDTGAGGGERGDTGAGGGERGDTGTGGGERGDTGARGGGDERAEADWKRLAETAERLRRARPSMTALENRVNRAMSRADRTAASVESAARAVVAEAVRADRDAATRASALVTNERVLTLSRSGTVAAVLADAPSSVVVAESRPAREGVGVAERLAEGGVDVTLVTDAAVAHVLSEGEVDAVVVGADTVLPDGSVVNKTGTRGAAVAAANEGVPTYAVAAADKVAAASGVELESGPTGEVYDGDADLAVENPTFDLTPAAFVTGVVTERGVLDASDVGDVAAEFRERADWRGDDAA